MSGFSSLLNQFKQTTQQVSASSSSSSRVVHQSSSDSNKKRPRSIFEAANTTTITQNSGAKKTANTTTQQQQQQAAKYNNYPTTPVKTIYIACPAYAETGGPEALHQLCHVINTGEYSYAMDDDNDNDDNDDGGDGTNNNKAVDGVGAGAGNNNNGTATQCDEFGRAIVNKDGKSANDTTIATTTTTTQPTKKKKNVIKAYMLYLRERSNNTTTANNDDSAPLVEHVTSTRAKSFKYDKYDAPCAQTLPLTIDLDYGDNDQQQQQQQQQQNKDDGYYTSELVIWPECWTHLIDSLLVGSGSTTKHTTTKKKKKKYQIAIWWLSVNNNKGRFLPNQFVIRKDILHLVQSTYAKEYVSAKLIGGGGDNKKGGKSEEKGRKGVGEIALNVMSMTEFISYASAPTTTTFAPHPKKEEQVVEEKANTNTKKRDIDVVYNTAKGMHYTDEIIKRVCGKKFKTNNDDGSVIGGGGITFHPIGKGINGRERMTGDEVVALLKRSKVYIDFGPHPGMDRLPREAALAGCVVLTNREGAANFEEDVPLPSEFKFAKFNVDVIASKLKECCNKHEEYGAKMKSYKEWILGQEKQMEVIVDLFINRVCTRRIDARKIAKGAVGK